MRSLGPRSEKQPPREFFAAAIWPRGAARCFLLLEPLGDEVVALVDVHGLVEVGAEHGELVWCEGRNHDDVPGGALASSAADGELGVAADDDEGLDVGMPVQPRAGAHHVGTFMNDRDA